VKTRAYQWACEGVAADNEVDEDDRDDKYEADSPYEQVRGGGEAREGGRGRCDAQILRGECEWGGRR